MNKKLSLLLLSGIISASVILNGGEVNALLLKQTSDAAIIETYGYGYEAMLNHISGSSLPKLDKCYQKFEISLKNTDFNKAEMFFADYVKELKIAQQKENKAEFNRSYNMAVSSLQEVSNRFPLNAYPKFFLATMYKFANDYDNAFELIRDCIELDNKNQLYKFALASLYMETNQYEKAVRIYEQLQNQYPREKRLRTALADAYLKMNSYADAVKEYRVAAAFEPEDKDVVSALVTSSAFLKYEKKHKAPIYEPVVMVSDKQNDHVAEGVTLTTDDNHEVVMFGNNPVPVYASNTIYKTKMLDGKGRKINVRVNPVAEDEADTQVQDNGSKYEFKQPQKTPELVKGSENVQNVSQKTTATTEEKKSSPKKSVYFLNNGQNAQAKQPVSLKTTEKKEVFQTKQEKQHVSAVSDKKTNVAAEENKVVKTVTVNQKNDATETLKTSHKLIIKNDNANSEEVVSKKNNSNDVNIEKNSVSESVSLETSKTQTDNVFENAQPEKTAAVQEDNSLKTDNLSKDKKSKKKDKKKKNKKADAEVAVNTDSAQHAVDNTETYIKANELLSQNQYQQAIDLLETINPPTLRSLTSIASCYNALGNTDAAIDYYNRADKISPDNSQILFSLAYLHFSKNETEKAENYLNHSLQVDPNNANALQLKDFIAQQAVNTEMNNAISLMNSGNYTDSKKILDELAKKDSSNFQVYYYLGHVCYATQKYADAVQDFLKSIKLNSDYALSYYSLGLSYDKLKKFSDSLASYEKFVQMSTDDNKYTQYAKTRISTIKADK